MTLDSVRFQRLLNAFDLARLFNELGWDHAAFGPQEIQADGGLFTLTPIAQKRGVTVFRCSPDDAGRIPLRPVLLKIEKEAAKLAHEHLLVFTDAAEFMQTWLWVLRVPGQPTVTRTHTWHRGSSGESLRQKLGHIVWSLDDEEAITLTDVITGLRRAFDRDKVSKRFYERFKTEHQAFSGFIEGLADATDRAWYASLMLNRLMFVYFIQRKGFLDGNPDYLKDRLRRLQSESGSGHFHSFYRLFLRRLFHEGLGQPRSDRAGDLAALVGDVPYLNGGLFALHELEDANPSIDIPDQAFERLFEFFDAYDWHLDDRPLRTGTEINPDVLGYIFEKYINQKQMGAYYTKEDITEYISKNTVIPYLLQQTRAQCREAFAGPASVWSLLSADPDGYIYPAMKTGVVDANGAIVPESELPEFVRIGMHDPKARMFDRRYNLGEALFHTPTGERGTLPTETWREYVERRNRCLEVHAKLASGEVCEIDDLITLNLNIRQFMQDVIDTCDSPLLLKAIWHTIVGRIPEKSTERFRRGIAVLDPTCGSGAFLFAALNVLEPLYEACLDRMEGFIEDARKLGKPVDKEFARVLEEVGRHPSRRYYIYKSIILNNLFGVDIMAEAVEICKLRLFLKLVSQVDSGQELEPLPDMDFNIRCGNTLVGYATEAQFDEASKFFNSAHRAEIKARMADLSESFDRFRELQTVHGATVTTEDKRRLRDALGILSLELDRYLARDYGIDPDNESTFAAWRTSHQPFHWFAEFYGITLEGGFDIVIGNPPYIQLSEIRGYQIRGYSCTDCGNIYPVLLERCLSIAGQHGKQGYIVPVSSISTDGYRSLQEQYRNQRVHISCYDDRPSRLFDGLEHIRLVIFLLSRSSEPEWLSTRYQKWSTPERGTLFERLAYIPVTEGIVRNSIPKLTSRLELSILSKLACFVMTIGGRSVRSGPHSISFSRKVGYFLQVLDFQPRVLDGAGNLRPPSEFKLLSFASAEERTSALALLNSNLFYWFITIFSDCRHLNKREIDAMPFPDVLQRQGAPSRRLQEHSDALMTNLRLTADTRIMRFRHDRLEIECIIPKRSKHLIDAIDLDIADGFRFSSEETDFIINYDIKFRMGGVEE
ncbi:MULTISPECIES: Eco57I restriction-modification methylase domain-containing protein [unclassified Thiocapsa]|uniref:Eco57I restriction-modification methylase domain-containing protein n=1 Tax=unclassified Thiocapsa TaxID=2641286 RepID=UPI0035B48A00